MIVSVYRTSRMLAAAWVAAMFLTLALPIQAQSPAVDDEGLTALEAYTQRDYARAIGLYRALAERFPKDSMYPFMAAKCHNRLGQPEEALAAIETAVANGATFATIPYERGRAYYLLGDDARAVENYAAYHGKVPGDVVSNEFYAEALNAVGRNEEALQRLSGVTPPKELKFRHEVLTAAAEAGLNRTDDALSRLDRLAGMPLDLDTRRFLFGLRAQIENKALGVDIDLQRVQPTAREERRAWNAFLTLGAEFDTNVPTLGKEVLPRPAGLEDHEDKEAWRAYALVHGDYRHVFNDRFTATAALDFYGNANGNSLSEFDVYLTSARLAPEFRLWKSNIFTGVEGSWRHTWLDSNSFDVVWAYKPYVTVLFSEYVVSQISMRVAHENYFVDHGEQTREDLDNVERRFEFVTEVRVKGTSLVLRAGFYNEHVNADGEDLDHVRQGWFGGFRYTLPYEFELAARVDHSKASFEQHNARLDFQGRRVDKDLSWGVSLSREVIENLDLSVYHTNYDEESNVDEFFYHRGVTGFAATYKF